MMLINRLIYLFPYVQDPQKGYCMTKESQRLCVTNCRQLSEPSRGTELTFLCGTSHA